MQTITTVAELRPEDQGTQTLFVDVGAVSDGKGLGSVVSSIVSVNHRKRMDRDAGNVESEKFSFFCLLMKVVFDESGF